ncbi:MAG: hypothetical protein WDO14_09790 [Bacteroidota bacterium]
MTSTDNGDLIFTDEFEFDGNNRFKKVTAFWSNQEQPDSTLVYYSTDGRVEKVDFYDNGIYQYPTVTWHYSYPDTKTVSIVTASINPENPGGPQIEQSHTVYTIDDKLRPFPDEYYYINTGILGAYLKNNVLVLKSSNASTENTTTYSLNYNAGGYPTTSSNTTGSKEEYLYQCDPPKESK